MGYWETIAMVLLPITVFCVFYTIMTVRRANRSLKYYGGQLKRIKLMYNAAAKAYNNLVDEVYQSKNDKED